MADAVRRTGARVVHAHNTAPTFGWRALAAAREAGARVVLHLHNYRLVCAVGTCFTRGEDCTRCHGRNTLPGVRLNCRGGSRAESAAYAAGLALWQRRLAGAADEIVVPSAFALGRLRELGAPLGDKARVLGSVQREFAERSGAASGEFVLAAGRLTPEKGFADVVDACARADLPLVIAGDGPERAALERARARARSSGQHPARGARGASRAGRPWRSCLRGTPRSSRWRRWRRWRPASRPWRRASGGLIEAVPEEGLYPPGDVDALAARLTALWRDEAAGERALEVANARSAPRVIASQLTAVYGGATSNPNR